jgi:PEGA domain
MAGWRLWLLLAAVAPVTAAGCVERRFVIETNVPGAEVYVNNQPTGPSPADARWEYPGKYEFRAVAQGFEPVREVKQISPKWYEYPGLDFVAEVVWPFHIEDVRRIQLTLCPAAMPRPDVLLDAANNLRERAKNLPPPEHPDPPPAPPVPPTPTAPPPAVIPVPDEPGSPAATRPTLPPRPQ